VEYNRHLMGYVISYFSKNHRQVCFSLAALITVCLLSFSCGSPTEVVRAPDRPNVILILTDDLDVRLLEEHLADYPNIRKLAAEGTSFENAFVTDPLCCPSRATILRGQYAHNHQIVGNWEPRGGSKKFRVLGLGQSTVATWLQDESYRTVLVGKYMNGSYGTRVPVGWEEWYAIAGDYLSTDLSENGRVVGYDPERHHLDDVLAEKAVSYVSSTSANGSPFFMWLGTKAPHAPATPAPRYEDAYLRARLPRIPSFNEHNVSDKPAWIRDNPPLEAERIAPMDRLYRKRLQSMLAVDEMIGQLVEALKESGELDETYLFFTSDNGFHLGTHRLTAGKWTAYEEDIRVPLIVRGPGVPEGRKLEHLVLNNDLAPTFADLAGAEVPPFVDGRSLGPLLTDNPPPPDDWRHAFLVEAAAEWIRGFDPPLSGDQLPDDRRHAPREDWGRPGLKAIRTKEHLYVEYETGERELYYLKKDSYQLDNAYEDADPELLSHLQRRLAALRGCSETTCRAAETTPTIHP
jgi:N-acetylglucosamine-6-sulfatase